MSNGARAIRVLHEDAGGGFVIVEKPAGLLSVPGRGAETDPAKADCVIARVRSVYPDARGPMVVHRLDMETSGLMVVALTPGAQRELSVAFQDRLTRKRYEAVVSVGGRLWSDDEGVVEVAMRADIDDRPRQVVDPFRGKDAETRFRVVERWEDAGGVPLARLSLEPVTGRSHQLRVHCAASAELGGLGSPILGDALYGDGVGRAVEAGGVERSVRPAMRGGRLLLHACWLRLPWGGGWVESASPAAF